MINLVVSSFGTSALCALIAVMLPRRLHIARSAVTAAPATATIVGCCGVCVAVGVTIVYAFSLLLLVTLLLAPFVAFGWMLLLILSAVGWVVIAEPFGHMLLRRRAVYAAPIVAAAVGGFVLTFGLQVLSWLPFGDWISPLIGFVLGLAGLGALFLTRLGTRPYPAHYFASGKTKVEAAERLIL